MNILKIRRGGSRLSRQAQARKGYSPALENFEKRELLTGGAIGFLSGTVFLDSSASPELDAAKARVPGATVTLYKAGDGSEVAHATTDAQGNYAFTDLEAGDYLLRQSAPAGYQNTGAQALSQLNPASVSSVDTIAVTVADPSSVVLNYSGFDNYHVVNVDLYGVAITNTVGQMNASLGSGAGLDNLNAGYLTFCVNDQQSLPFYGPQYPGTTSFQVTPSPITSLTNADGVISPERAGRIAFLFNHYGNADLNADQAGGLQLAIWELLYDDGPTADFTSGNFAVTSPYGDTTQDVLDAMLNEATAYFNASAAQNETAIFLDAASANPGQTVGLQGMLAQGSYNFSIEAQPLAQLSGKVFVDKNGDCTYQTGEQGLAGVTITLKDALGAAVATTKTDADGDYYFVDLLPGIYTVVEENLTAYRHAGQTAGSTGGTTANFSITTTLVAGDTSTANNFCETVCPPKNSCSPPPVKPCPPPVKPCDPPVKPCPPPVKPCDPPVKACPPPVKPCDPPVKPGDCDNNPKGGKDGGKGGKCDSNDGKGGKDDGKGGKCDSNDGKGGKDDNKGGNSSSKCDSGDKGKSSSKSDSKKC